MKLSPIKLFIILIAAAVIFFGYTYSQNWGVTVAEKNTTDHKARVIEIKDNYLLAKKECPSIVNDLKAGLPELQKNKRQQKIYLNYRMIAQCELAAKNYKQALKYYEKLVIAYPQQPRYYERFATALFEDGNLGEALRYSHLAVQLDPKFYKGPLLEARILKKMNKDISAIDAYEAALKIAPYKKLDTIREEMNALIERHNLNMSGL